MLRVKYLRTTVVLARNVVNRIFERNKRESKKHKSPVRCIAAVVALDGWLCRWRRCVFNSELNADSDGTWRPDETGMLVELGTLHIC